MSQTFSRWQCWVCGATHGANELRLTTCGLTVFNHLRKHEREGLLRRTTFAERDRGAGVFELTAAGRETIAMLRREQNDDRSCTPEPRLQTCCEQNQGES